MSRVRVPKAAEMMSIGMRSFAVRAYLCVIRQGSSIVELSQMLAAILDVRDRPADKRRSIDTILKIPDDVVDEVRGRHRRLRCRMLPGMEWVRLVKLVASYSSRCWSGS